MNSNQKENAGKNYSKMGLRDHGYETDFLLCIAHIPLVCEIPSLTTISQDLFFSAKKPALRALFDLRL